MVQVTPEGYARIQAHFTKTRAMSEARQAVIDAAKAWMREKNQSRPNLERAVVALEKLEAS